ncbi:hypothetical protein BGW41_002957 [Actinomortierella wolfii]|nr:hypothetical protein BGW41_002957 [Actinomortierella wolfii]
MVKTIPKDLIDSTIPWARPQPRLLYTSQRNGIDDKSRSKASTSFMQQHQQDQQSKTIHYYRSRDPSSVRLVCRLWYGIWLDVRLCHHDWTLGENRFDLEAALEVMRRMPGRQRVVIQCGAVKSELSSFVQAVVYDVQFCIALLTLATELTKRTVREQHPKVQQEKQRQIQYQLQRVGHGMQYEQEDTTSVSTSVRELCLKGAPRQLKVDALALLLQHPIFRNITLLDLSFKYVAGFDIQALFESDMAIAPSNTMAVGSSGTPQNATFYFSSLRHLLIRNIKPSPVPPALFNARPPRGLITFVLDGIFAPVPTISDLVRLFRTPTLKRIHISRPVISNASQISPTNPISPEGGQSIDSGSLMLSPNNSYRNILDVLFQVASPQPVPLLESLALEFMSPYEYDVDEWSEMPWESTFESYYCHSVHLHEPTQKSLAAYLQSTQSRALRELHAPSIPFDVTPFINSFSPASSTNSHTYHSQHNNQSFQPHATGIYQHPSSSNITATSSSCPIYNHTVLGPTPFQWHCRHLRKLQMSFLTSSSEEAICVQSSREIFGFISYNCPLIEDLDLQSNWILLSWDSGFCLTSRWRHLKHLVLRGCSLGWESPLVSAAQEKRASMWWPSSAFDNEWILQQPTKDQIQKRKSSRSMCRDLLRLPPFSRSYRESPMEDNERGSAGKADNGQSKYHPYHHRNDSSGDESEYEPGSLASALAPMLELECSNWSSSDEGLSSQELSSKGKKSKSRPIDRREGALWEKLRSVRIVTEGFTHSNWQRSQMPWKNYTHSWHHLRPDVDFKITFGHLTPPLLRAPVHDNPQSM